MITNTTVMIVWVLLDFFIAALVASSMFLIPWRFCDSQFGILADTICIEMIAAAIGMNSPAAPNANSPVSGDTASDSVPIVAVL